MLYLQGLYQQVRNYGTHITTKHIPNPEIVSGVYKVVCIALREGTSDMYDITYLCNFKRQIITLKVT